MHRVAGCAGGEGLLWEYSLAEETVGVEHMPLQQLGGHMGAFLIQMLHDHPPVLQALRAVGASQGVGGCGAQHDFNHFCDKFDFYDLFDFYEYCNVWLRSVLPTKDNTF